MAEFRYKARDTSGGAKTGVVDAPNRSTAASQLRSRGLIVTGIDPIISVTASQRNFKWNRFLPVRSIDVELSLQQLAMMIRGGMSLLAALTSLEEQASRQSMATIWGNVIQDIQTGDSLSTAIAKHNCFPEFAVQLIGVGERTGEIPPVLERAVATMRARRTGVQEVTSALIYPVMVIFVALGVTIYMVAYLIPRLEVYLQSLGKDMPPMTQKLVDVSSWMRQYYPITIILLCGILVLLVAVSRSSESRMILDKWLLKIPVVGTLIKLCETATLARSLSVMLGSGITLIDGLGTSEKLLTNRFTASTVENARNKIIEGGNFAEAIGKGNAFSPMLQKMIAVGQQSGDLKGVLAEVASFHEQQFQSLIRRLNAILTPTLTIGVGAVVGYVYIAFFVALLAAGN
ncbi:MAG: type II secretion system F family protein [Planctomycetota bacterium]